MNTTTLTLVHFVHNYLINPTNPVTVNLIGAGGTGSRMLTALDEISYSLKALGHAGLHVTLFDDDIVSYPNIGRQRFADAEIGLYKSVALINRINRCHGNNWKAVTEKFERYPNGNMPEHARANIYISCVDTVAARYGIAEILKDLSGYRSYSNRDKVLYWMDFGNARYTGQVLLSTITAIQQPASKQYEPVTELPLVTEEFKELLDAQADNNEPSCSHEEAFMKQDLFINAKLVAEAGTILWNMFRYGVTDARGAFVNILDHRTQPIGVG
jgi:PRTRC genetic system ThiF family protein